MKNIRVAAAVIKKDNKIFATQRGYGEFKDGWEFPGARLRREKLLSRRLSEKSGRN